MKCANSGISNKFTTNKCKKIAKLNSKTAKQAQIRVKKS